MSPAPTGLGARWPSEADGCTPLLPTSPLQRVRPLGPGVLSAKPHLTQTAEQIPL